MKLLFSLALAACLPLAAHAAPAPQDAQASVPSVVYRSAFDTYQSAVEDEATPDETWRAVNRKVGDAGGHMGQMMKDHKMPMKMPIAKPAAPEAQAEQHHEHQGH
ncbi:hypothetical protein [Janthinobacterium psychrotolerans]|uniref:Uncharacterized protein n=1 Tax=Janthinobacterium psychrotolerans TaxID=1747903 RepID=A0A1A7BY66_9BURK|nr:hypothetical protein [Janthinobacterium psychrotolerans]OBV38462.1 hypothetical protein ASR47_100662 [Janthinobacterium psychrotolerans]